MTRARIAVTGPARGGGAAWYFTALAVRLAGGIPIKLRPGTITPLAEFHGLILGGGADINPTFYGENRSVAPKQASRQFGFLDYFISPLSYVARKLAARKTGSWVDPERDDFEFRLLKEALSHHLPILGICRGQQLLNIYFGGSLHQSLSTLYVEDPEVQSHFPRKLVKLLPDTHLREVVDRSQIRVNGLHRQGIKKLGRGLRVAALDSNNIIQAIEHVESSFVIGVQWHPEYLPQRSEQRKIFRRFILEAHKLLVQGEQGSTAVTGSASNVRSLAFEQ